VTNTLITRNFNVGYSSYLFLGFFTGPYKINFSKRINISLLLVLLLNYLYSNNNGSNINIFLCASNMSIKFVLNQSMDVYRQSFKFYYINVRFMGLGFRLKKLAKNLLKLFLVRPNFVYLFVPHSVLVVLPRLGNYAKVKRLLFLGFNSFILNCLVADVLLLKKLSPYRVYGILNPKRLVILRSGKQR